jgi:hypothetical protein
MESRDARIALTGSAGIGIAVALLGLLTEGSLFYVGVGLALLGGSYAFVDEALTQRAHEREEAPHPDD